jgi:hypothetical protein
MTDTEKAEYEDILRRLTAKCEELVAENARLRSSENNAHSVCREIYSDPGVSPAIRLKAASIAIGHESAPLKPVEPALELTAEPIKDSQVLCSGRDNGQTGCWHCRLRNALRLSPASAMTIAAMAAAISQ